MVTYNSAGEQVGIADPVLDDQGQVRFISRPNLADGTTATTEVDHSALRAEPFKSAGQSTELAASESAGGSPSPVSASAAEPWWSNPKNTPSLIIASVCAGAFLFLVATLAYRMIGNPARPEYSGYRDFGRVPQGNSYRNEEYAPAPRQGNPGNLGQEAYPPVPTEPVPSDPNNGPTPGDLGPTDPALDRNVTDPSLAPTPLGAESGAKQSESGKKPLDLRGEDEDSGASSSPQVPDPKTDPESKSTETKNGSGPDLRGGNGI